MNLKEAGYEMLVMLSVADRNYDVAEGKIIHRFLDRYKSESFDMDALNAHLLRMQAEELPARFDAAAKAFYEQATDAEQADFIAFAFLLIEADEVITKEESKILYSLATNWGLDPTLLVEDKTLTDFL